MMLTVEQLDKLGDHLVDTTVPLKARFRALFTLKNLGGTDAVRNISKGFRDNSALLKHECGYCLGQMQDKSAIPVLIDVLSDRDEDPMVRHEAGEALGAIGDYANQTVLNVLTEFLADENKAVSETCEIALQRLDWLRTQANIEANSLSTNPYYSVDPAPPTPVKHDVNELKDILVDEDRKLFERYRAMFALRNLNTDEAILALCEGLTPLTSSYSPFFYFFLFWLERLEMQERLVSP
jgi:deoxyhypusine monooxygenase